MPFKNILFASVVFITHTSCAMHGNKQITIQRKRMRENLQKKRVQDHHNAKLLYLCNTDITNKDLPFQLKLRNDAKNLLDNGADIETQTLQKLNSLYYACHQKNMPMIKLLIAYGANVNTRMQEGLVPLHIAADAGSFEIVNILTMAQADVNVQTFTYKYTPLHYSTNNSHYNIVKNLLEHKANPDMQKLDGATPLYIATEKELIDIIRLLLTFDANPNIPHISGCTSLHLACKAKNTEIVEILLENNANPNIQTLKKSTPMHLAIQNKHIAIINLLCRFQAYVNIQDYKGITPLHRACGMDHAEIVQILLNNKANPNAQVSIPVPISERKTNQGCPKVINGVTPLHIACIIGNPEIVTMLLNVGADINAKTSYRDTPLHTAIIQNHPEVVEILLKKGADHETSLFLADHHKNPIIIDLLHEYGAPKVSDEQAQKDKEAFFEQINQEKEPVISTTESSSTQPATSTSSFAKASEDKQKSSPIIRTNDENISTKSTSTKQATKTTADVQKSSSCIITNDEYQLFQDKKLEWPKFLTPKLQCKLQDQLRQLKYWSNKKELNLKKKLNIKTMRGTKGKTYRLSYKKCRVFFRVDKKTHNIFIIEIGPRKNIYKKIKKI